MMVEELSPRIAGVCVWPPCRVVLDEEPEHCLEQQCSRQGVGMAVAHDGT